MNTVFNFGKEPLEVLPEFGEGTFDTELADPEGKEEFRRGRSIPGRAPARSQRPLRLQQSRPTPAPSRPPKRPPPRPRFPRRPTIIRRRIVPEPAPCVCPAHGTEFIRWVQSSLNQILGLSLPVNGIMNTATRDALRRFQEQQGLTADGIAGPETEKALVDAKGSQGELFDFDLFDPLQQKDLEIIGTDSRVLITNTKAVPYRYICGLEYEFGGKVGTKARGTAFLVGPRTAVTAGHVVHGKGKNGKLRLLKPSKMRVIPGRKGALEPFGSVRATRFILAPGFRRTSATDYAVIHLAAPIGDRVGFWSQEYRRRPGDPVGTSFLRSGTAFEIKQAFLNLSGYPRDLPAKPALRCRLPGAAPNTCSVNARADQLRLCGSFQYRAVNKAVRLRAGLLCYLNDTCPGHSGSPVWVKRSSAEGGRVLVGIHILSQRGSNCAVFLNSSVRQFIAANTR